KGGFHIDVHSKHDYLYILKKINEMMSYDTRSKFVRNMHGIDLLNGIERVKNDKPKPKLELRENL
ncbi:MAG: hypothetical protein QF371_02290, partial [Flavobacteriales bacterium]|nr:hypothetical protein [Flavobacteriales bacterium]